MKSLLLLLSIVAFSACTSAPKRAVRPSSTATIQSAQTATATIRHEARASAKAIAEARVTTRTAADNLRVVEEAIGKLETMTVADSPSGMELARAKMAARQAQAANNETSQRLEKSEATVAIVSESADLLEKQLTTVKAQALATEKERDELRVANLDLEARATKEKHARVAAEKHVSRIKTWLGGALGAVLVFLVQLIPWSLIPPPAGLYGRVAASAAALGAGWLIVARFV